MIIYNETIILEESIQDEWLKWMKEIHIPAILSTGFFSACQMLQVIDSPNEGVTYCIQYQIDNLEDFQTYSQSHLPDFQTTHHQRFENKFVLFGSLMQTV